MYKLYSNKKARKATTNRTT